jgi:hypothetical protein
VLWGEEVKQKMKVEGEEVKQKVKVEGEDVGAWARVSNTYQNPEALWGA